MITAGISSRYAKALVSFAREEKQQECVYKEMARFGKSILEVPDLFKALDNPALLRNQKESLIITACGGNVSDVTLRFIRLVLQKKREQYLDRMAMKYIDLYRKENQIMIAELVTADSANEEVEQRMRDIIKKYRPVTVEFSTRLDPSVIGGFILYIGTYRVDASISTQLKEVKNQFLVENSK